MANFITIFIHSVVRLSTRPEPLQKRFLNRYQCSAFSFKFQHPPSFERPSSSSLCFVSRLSFTSILPSVFPSVTCFRMQFLRKMLPTYLAFLFFIVCRIFLSEILLSLLNLRLSNRFVPASLIFHYTTSLSYIFETYFPSET
jgi:hypothetical protein